MSPHIVREDAVRRMSRELRPLSDSALTGNRLARIGCYILAGVTGRDIEAHDAAAVRAEQLRRVAFAASVTAKARAA